MIRKEWIALLAALMLLVGVCAASAQESSSPYRLGVGLGIPYGVIGVNAEMKTDTQLTPFVGVGYAMGLGWAIGGHYYFSAPVGGVQKGTRLTLGYGVTTLLQDVWNDNWDQKTGLFFGIGTQGKNWNFDLLFIQQPDIPAGFDEQGGNIKISVGYMFK